VTLTHRGERHFHPAQGAHEGEPGTCAISRIVRRDGPEEVVPSKVLTTVDRGDRLIVETAGGGGYGAPPHARPGGRARRCAQRQGERSGSSVGVRFGVICGYSVRNRTPDLFEALLTPSTPSVYPPHSNSDVRIHQADSL
jgi:N-methylhydantoinase B/oxoprolinase/acetone carboxylase alpha subunit